MNPNRPSTILSDVEIKGSMTFMGDLHFDGQLHDGDIIGEDLVLGPEAVIHGNINVTSLVLHGSVKGEVMVTGRCELKGTASLVGSLISNRLAMDDGATLIGGIVITPESTPDGSAGHSKLPPVLAH